MNDALTSPGISSLGENVVLFRSRKSFTFFLRLGCYLTLLFHPWFSIQAFFPSLFIMFPHCLFISWKSKQVPSNCSHVLIKCESGQWAKMMMNWDNVYFVKQKKIGGQLQECDSYLSDQSFARYLIALGCSVGLPFILASLMHGLNFIQPGLMVHFYTLPRWMEQRFPLLLGIVLDVIRLLFDNKRQVGVDLNWWKSVSVMRELDFVVFKIICI